MYDLSLKKMLLTKFCHPWDVDNMELRSVPDFEVVLLVVLDEGGNALRGCAVWRNYEDEEFSLWIWFGQIIRVGQREYLTNLHSLN